MRSLPYILLLLLPADMSGQYAGMGSWNILNVKYSLDEKWNLFGEAQVRSLKFYDDFHYYEYKGGVEFKAYNSVRLTLGAGSYQTYKEGGNFVLPKNNDEFRIWPQITLLHTVGNLKVDHRYRSEMRFTTSGYRNRFRLRVGVSLPFGKKKQGYKPFQVSASNELFFTDNEPYFERNRVMAAMVYKPSKNISFQIGFLHQFDYRINDESGKDFLVTGIYFELFRGQDRHPVTEIDPKDN